MSKRATPKKAKPAVSIPALKRSDRIRVLGDFESCHTRDVELMLEGRGFTVVRRAAEADVLVGGDFALIGPSARRAREQGKTVLGLGSLFVALGPIERTSS